MSPVGAAPGGIRSGMELLDVWPRLFHPVAMALSERGQRHSTSQCPDWHSEHHVGIAWAPWGHARPGKPNHRRGRLQHLGDRSYPLGPREDLSHVGVVCSQADECHEPNGTTPENPSTQRWRQRILRLSCSLAGQDTLGSFATHPAPTSSLTPPGWSAEAADMNIPAEAGGTRLLLDLADYAEDVPPSVDTQPPHGGCKAEQSAA